MTAEQQQAVNQRLKELQEEHGALTADVVIADAKDSESPLHGHFEWDIERAAYRPWVTIANRIINSFKVHVTIEEFTVKIPTYVREPESPKMFCPIAAMAKRADDRKDVLNAEVDRAARAIERAKGVASGLNFDVRILRLLDSALATLEKAREAMESAPPPQRKPLPRKRVHG
jgi:AmiR/NasT family two-component response regulator